MEVIPKQSCSAPYQAALQGGLFIWENAMGRRTALRLVETSTLDRRQWLEIRRGGIGSSDAAAAVGLSPYKSQLELWLEKTGRAAKVEDANDPTSPMYWGTLLEANVATAYTHKTGRRVRKLNAVLQHPTIPFMMANIDREIVGDPEIRILECKTAGEFGSQLWRDGVPEYVQLQVQHQLAVTGHAAADVAVLLCGQALEIHRIQRDEDLIARLTLLECRFWEYVTSDGPPPADGSASAGRALRQLFIGNDTSLDFTENAELCATFDALAELKGELEAREQEAERLKQTLQQAMGDASRAMFTNGVITYRRAKDSQVLDTKQLAADHPALASRYTTTRTGARRFLLAKHTQDDARRTTC